MSTPISFNILDVYAIGRAFPQFISYAGIKILRMHADDVIDAYIHALCSTMTLHAARKKNVIMFAALSGFLRFVNVQNVFMYTLLYETLGTRVDAFYLFSLYFLFVCKKSFNIFRPNFLDDVRKKSP